MPTLFVRYETRDGGVDEVVSAVEAAFAAVNEQHPESIRWTYWHGPGKNEFGALLQLADGVENPLPMIGEAHDVQAAVAKWVDGDTPVPRPITVIGSYGLT